MNEDVKKVADQYYNFTIKQGWKLAGFEQMIREASYKFAQQICQLESKPDEAEAKAIDCLTECIHYESCLPFVNPVGCTGKESKPEEEALNKERTDFLNKVYRAKPDRLLTDEEKAREKGFDNVIDWYLACLNAEINILLDPTLRTSDRLDTLAKQAKIYIEKIAKTASIKDAEMWQLLDGIIVAKDYECQQKIEEILDLLNVHIDNYMDEHGVKKGHGAAYKALSEFRQALRIKKA